MATEMPFPGPDAAAKKKMLSDTDLKHCSKQPETRDPVPLYESKTKKKG
jgi:hypothetical protein